MRSFVSSPLAVALGTVALSAQLASAHIAMWHKSMYGFNVTGSTYSWDNRPQAPLMGLPFNKWWFHGHLDHPPNDGDFLELPAGGSITAELSCDKGATSWFASSQGGWAGDDSNWPCPGQPSSQFHTTGENDLAGSALAIAYESDVSKIKPEDFTVFSVVHRSVWTLRTDFQIPAAMPACPEGGCHCAWFWIHNFDSGAEQMYMNGFKCKVTGATGTVAIGRPQPPRRCGADNVLNRAATPSNCTVGPQQPLYWFQQDGNNMFEDQYNNPRYNDLYGFADGTQDYIFTGAGTVSPKPEFIGGPKYAPFVQGSAPQPAAAAPSSSSSAAEAAPTSTASPEASPTSSSSPLKETAPATSPAADAGATASPAPAAASPDPAPSSSSSPALATSTPVAAASPTSTDTPAATTSATTSVVAAPASTDSPAAVTSSSTSSVADAATTPASTNVLVAVTSSSSATVAAASPTTSVRRCKQRKTKRSTLERAHVRHKRRFGRLAHDTTLN